MEGLVVNKTPLKQIDNGRCYAKLTSNLLAFTLLLVTAEEGEEECHCHGGSPPPPFLFHLRHS